MNPLKKCTAIKALMVWLLFWTAGVSWAAQVAGTIVQLSGPLMARKVDGGMRILSMKSEVESGDTLVTEKNTYAMVKFIDNSEITLKPSTTFKVENFSYDAGKPDGDNASFNLVKGGLRSVTGLLGKRNKEKFAMKTPSATIGIRGTTFIAEIVEPTPEAVAVAVVAREAWLLASTASLDPLAAPVQPLLLAQGPVPVKPVARSPGLYLQVLEGAIFVANASGSTLLSTGQFGLVPTLPPPPPPSRPPTTIDKAPPTSGAAPAPSSPLTPVPAAPMAPVLIPSDPGIEFNPPPSFTPLAVKGTVSAPSKSTSVDCEVR